MTGITVRRSRSGSRSVFALSRRTLAVLMIVLYAQACAPCITAHESDLVKADELFRQERWVDARTAYGDVVKNAEPPSLSVREATRGAVLSSLQLQAKMGPANTVRHTVKDCSVGFSPHSRY